jgi:antitoxin component YwqK of YwqJK toxin-antitoxin module
MKTLLASAALLASIGTGTVLSRDYRVVETRFPNGQLAERREYRAGIEHGTHQGWHENGTRRFLYAYRNGLAEGVQQTWYPSGAAYTRFEYAAGRESGRQQMWTERGELRANYVVANGRRYGLPGTTGCEGTTP